VQPGRGIVQRELKRRILMLMKENFSKKRMNRRRKYLIRFFVVK
jgi:hypothetical protein